MRSEQIDNHTTSNGFHISNLWNSINIHVLTGLADKIKYLHSYALAPMPMASFLQLITDIHNTEDCFYRLTTKPALTKFNYRQT